MTEPTRSVNIDDRDRRVQFTGNWIAASGDAYNNRGRHGPVYRNTLRGSNVDGAKLAFTFSGEHSSTFFLCVDAPLIKFHAGTKAEILGTTDPDPNWDCILDGGVVSAAKGASSQPGEGSINQWPFCSFSGLSSGQHTIELIVRTKGRTFWFDEIQYTPTGVVRGETVDADQGDQDLSYSAGWESYKGIAFITRTRGSTVTFPFSGEFSMTMILCCDCSLTCNLTLEGTGITLLGNYHTDLPNNPSAGSYTIDGSSPVSFTIRGGAGSDDYNRRLFEVSGLSTGTHTLVVTYQGGDGSMPLMVDRFFIEGGTNLRAQLPASGGGGGGDTETNPEPSSSSGISSSGSSTSTRDVGNPTATSATQPSNSGELPLQTQPGDPTANYDPSATGSPSRSSVPGGSANSNSLNPSSTNTRTTAIAVGVTLGVLALVVLLLCLIWLRRRRRIRLGSSDELDTFFDHANHQPAVSEVSTPVTNMSMSAPSGPVLSYAAAPHPEARSKYALASPHSANATSLNRAPESTFSGPSSDYAQSTVPSSTSTSVHQASGWNSTSSNANTRIAVLQHQDSGLRLPQDGQQTVETVEVPPLYSVQ